MALDDLNSGQPTGQPANKVAAKAGEIASRGAEQAQRLGKSTRERILRTVDEKKQTVSEKLDAIAQSITDAGQLNSDDLPAHLTGRAADAVKNVSRKLSTSSTEELLRAAGRKVRERPGLFLAGCLSLGFLTARMLRE